MKKYYPIRRMALRNALFVFMLTAFTSMVTAQNQVPTGAINGLFTVNSHGDQVYFSQGNLQYIGSAETPYWKFAENQWDFLGETTGQNSTNSDVDRDLFCWGTSGYNHGANCYQPWSTSQSNNDYYVYGSFTYNLFDQTGQADWGYNAISNGGNQQNIGWRMLTWVEWNYLFNTRTTISGVRYAKAIVNNTSGVILLPDGWQTSYYYLSSTNSSDALYNKNRITAAQWTILEEHGAVFLPAAGCREGASLNRVGSYGYYWSASYYDDDYAYRVGFYAGSLSASGSWPRCFGLSVRLVRPAESYSFSINATPNPAEGGVVSGGGAYQQGAECTLTATANEGFTFSCWTENGEVVSEDEIYTFVVTGDRNLVAHFSSTNPEPAGVVITLRPGWNWISFLLETEMLIEDALVNLTPCDGDMLKSQDNFATYKADLGQWSGSLRTMIPGQGYIYQRNGEQTTFTYPKE